jgi:hypothetical protein
MFSGATSWATGAVAAAVFAIGGLIGYQLLLSRLRRRRFQNLELTPNVLLTRYPIVFLGRSRSLFRLNGDFPDLPLYLYEHGYQVQEITVPSHAFAKRNKLGTLAIAKALESFSTRVHLIAHPSLSEAAHDLVYSKNNQIATLTLFDESPTRDRKTELSPPPLPIFARPDLKRLASPIRFTYFSPSREPNRFKKEAIALEHMVSLAEYDLR